MKIDFVLTASWARINHKQIKLWGTELADRGYEVALLFLGEPKVSLPDSVRTYVLEPQKSQYSPRDVEQKYGIPSLDHLTFTERKFFRLSREDALDRAVGLVSALESVFEGVEIENCLQIRGPEMHRLLAHYMVENRGGRSIWAGFSPFENTFSLQTRLDGGWDTYHTVPYDDIPESDRSEIRTHIEEFREEKKFYAHGNDETEEIGSKLRRLYATVRAMRQRTRPGTLTDQVRQELRLKVNGAINEQLYPDQEESKRLCQSREYVFLPLQYPIESRLTVFSPQFFRQEFLVEYVSRILPSSVDLFVKAHPNHPGRPFPETVYTLNNLDGVQFLHPDLSAHAVIEHSEGVIVTNNTVGFETLYYRKPLFTLGSALYSDTPATISVDDLGELPALLGTHLSESVAEERTISSIYSLREASYDGDRTSYESGNVETVVDSILEFCDDIEG